VIRAARWAALLGGVALALVYLNSAAFSAWAGTGPPPTNAFREAWMHRAFAHLCYGGAAALGGASLFRVMQRPLRLDRVVLALTVLVVLLLAAPRIRLFVFVEPCLHSEGRWDDATFRCLR
jgi:hypothetical protein